MAIKAQMESRATRVFSIMQSINEAIGQSGALGFLDEARRKPLPEPKEDPEALRARTFSAKAKRNLKQKEKARAKAKAEREVGAAPKKQVKFKKKEDYKKKAKKVAGKPDAPDAPPPPDDAAGATQAADGGLDDVYKSKKGKKLTLAPALQRMAKRRREGKVASGAPKVDAGKSIHDKIAALHQSVRELKDIVQRNGDPERVIQRPGAVPGRRAPMPQPKHGELPDEFQGQQAQKTKDLDWLEKERQRRSGVVKKAGKLSRMRGQHKLLRDPEHDVPKGYHKDPDSGDQVHSSGKSGNKKFANATTFGDSDDDAMLHTDKSETGSRGSADASEFVFKGDTEKDPRKKWYRVSKEGGYASAMASLGKSYHKAPDMRSKVISKVKSTGFTDSSGHQINVKPTGSMHNERGACQQNKKGRLSQLGQTLKKHDPTEFYRLCKGAHGGSGTAAGRSEYERGFDPQHDDSHKVRQLHKAAEAGKADKPAANIAQHALARPERRAAVRSAGRAINRAATGTKWRTRAGR